MPFYDIFLFYIIFSVLYLDNNYFESHISNLIKIKLNVIDNTELKFIFNCISNSKIKSKTNIKYHENLYQIIVVLYKLLEYSIKNKKYIKLTDNIKILGIPVFTDSCIKFFLEELIKIENLEKVNNSISIEKKGNVDNLTNTINIHFKLYLL